MNPRERIFNNVGKVTGTFKTVREWLITDADEIILNDREAVILAGIVLNLGAVIIILLALIANLLSEHIQDVIIVYIMVIGSFGAILSRDSNRLEVSLAGMAIICVATGLLIGAFPGMTNVIYTGFISLESLLLLGIAWPFGYQSKTYMIAAASIGAVVGWQTSHIFVDFMAIQSKQSGLLSGGPIVAALIVQFISAFDWFSKQVKTRDVCVDLSAHLVSGITNVAAKVKKFAIGGITRKDNNIPLGSVSIVVDDNTTDDQWYEIVSHLLYHADIVFLVNDVDGKRIINKLCVKDANLTMRQLPSTLKVDEIDRAKGFYRFLVQDHLSDESLLAQLKNRNGFGVIHSVFSAA